MKNQLRSLLGTKSRFHLAVEELDPTTTANPPSTEDTTVVMKGPLADVYSEALAKVYDKDAPIEGATAGDPAAQPEPTAETGAVVDTDGLQPKQAPELTPVEAETGANIEKVILESQAIDAAVAQSIATAISDEAPTDGTDFETIYAIDETQVTPQTVVDVTNTLAEAENPETVTVMVDDVIPDSVADAMPEAQLAQQKELILGLEHMVTGMGGKFVRGFSALVASRKKA